MLNAKFEEAVYNACYLSLIAMGEDYKKLSWFGKNQLTSKKTSGKKLK